MIKPEAGRNIIALDAQAVPAEPLPYRVEIWNGAADLEGRVVGRAASLPLARAVFTAAASDFPTHRITLSRGDKVLQEAPGGTEPGGR